MGGNPTGGFVARISGRAVSARPLFHKPHAGAHHGRRRLVNEGEACHMSELTIWTLDWVPAGPRGFVRDLRLRWACEEAGLTYAVRTIPFEGRETNHLARQPFGQVPFLDDGGLEIFESGAGLLHL